MRENRQYAKYFLIGLMLLLLCCAPMGYTPTQTSTLDNSVDPVDTVTTADYLSNTGYHMDFEQDWINDGWSEVSYGGYKDWYRSSSYPLPNCDPPSYYSARIRGYSTRSGAGILQSRTYDTTGCDEIYLNGFFRDVGVDNYDLKVYFKDSDGYWVFVADLNVIRTTYDWGNNWYGWEISSTNNDFKHANFAVRYQAKNIAYGEYAQLDNIYLRTKKRIL